MKYDPFIPFYRVYQEEFGNMPTGEREYKQMEEHYPKRARQILREITIQCDRLDYTGSLLYDEYPDPYLLYALCRQIYDRVNSQEEEIPKDLMLEYIQILLCQEIQKRRSRHQRGGKLF